MFVSGAAAFVRGGGLARGAFARRVGVLAGAGTAVVAFLSRASVGVGRFVEIGPDPLWTALFVAAEVGVGVVIGYAVSPLLERDSR